MMSPPGLEEEEITSGRRLTPAQDVFLFLPSLSFFFCRRRRRERRDPADKENLVGWPGENASLSFSPGKRRSTGHSRLFCVLWTVSSWNTFNREREFSFPRLIVVPLSSHAVDGVRKEKERLTAAEAWRLNSFILFLSHLSTAMIWKEEDKEEESRKKMWNRSRFPMTFSFVGILSSILFFLLLTGFQLFLQSLVSEELFETRGRKWRKASCKKKEGMVGPGSIADLARCSNHTSLLPGVERPREEETGG